MKKLTTFEKFRLRMALLRLWFFKNIKTFVWSFITIMVAITIAETIKATVVSGNSIWENVVSITFAVISLLTSGGIFVKTARRLSLDDIKSRKIKVALIRAGMVFNADGHLVKQIEKESGLDINQDGKIGNIDPSEIVAPEENIISGVIRSAGELGKILTAEIDDDTTLTEVAESTNVIEGKTKEERIREASKRDIEKTVENKIDKKTKGKVKNTDKMVNKTSDKLLNITSLTIDFIVFSSILIGVNFVKGLKHAGIGVWIGIKYTGIGIAWPFKAGYEAIQNRKGLKIGKFGRVGITGIRL